MNFSFFSRDKWDIESVNPPWGDRPSIYQHILANIRPGEPGLSEKGDLLPDEEIVNAGKQIRWAPGALDGVFGHHSGTSDATEIANKILKSLETLTGKSTDESAGALYSLLLEHRTLSYVDHLLEAVVNHDDLNLERLHTIAQWLATGATDREPVKCAIALLGVFTGGHDRDLLLTLGRHEELTLFVSVALSNNDNDSDLTLWSLACLVTGWGRIHIIERLTETRDEQIKAWMLREGYKNGIMQEYTALICAKTGELLRALRRPEPDDKLLTGAGSILTALIAAGHGGPFAGMESYEDGAEATELYLRHLQARDIDVQGFVDINTIEEFLKGDSSELNDTPGWRQRRESLLSLTKAILSRPAWEPNVREALSSENDQTFWPATQAARVLGVDAWDIYFERLKRGEDRWYFALQTDNQERVDRVLKFAEETLPLQKIASGPTDALGVGPEFRDHSALDSLLQELPRFPGKGWPLIQAGLQSPTVRNRNMAVQALAAWDRTTWPGEAEPLLKRAIKLEPEDRTREIMAKALAGESLETNLPDDG